MASDLSDQIRNALDLSTWDERRGFGSTKGPICPHCQTLQRAALCAKPCGRVGVARCETCGKEFGWRLSHRPRSVTVWIWDTWVDPDQGGV
jgi:hypothetical protein